jgi:superfamily I DNA/RNA helicase
MLAVEKARQLAASGSKVLLLCYNGNLARWLNEVMTKTPNVTIMTFSGLVRAAADQWAKLPPPVNKDDYFDKAEDILFDALGIVRSIPAAIEEHLFDAVIVDEAQDFKQDYWIPVAELLKDKTNGVFYVFSDDNQRIYAQLADIPLIDAYAPLTLSDNCRNTQSIFRLLRPYTKTTLQTTCIGPEGRAIDIKPTANDVDTKKTLQATLHQLITENGVHLSQIVILTPRNVEKSQWKEGMVLGNHKLTWTMSQPEKSAIRVSTIHSFKGLESPIVILTELDHAYAETRDQIIYIGVSRARNHLIIIGTLPETAESSA